MSFLYLLQSNKPFLLIFLFFNGLLIGSFLNVVIYRLPIMVINDWNQNTDSVEVLRTPSCAFNLAIPRSHCTHCNHALAWYENIPLISYLMLGGKCGHCKTVISMRYPAIELITGIAFVLAGLQHQFNPILLPALILVSALIALAAIDFDHFLLLDALTLPLLWIGLLTNAFLVNDGAFVSVNEAIYGCVFGYMFFWMINLYYEKIHKKTGIGGGDAKLMAALGAWFGIKSVLFQIIPLATGIALIFSLALIAIKKADSKSAFAFGPAICLAGALTLYFGQISFISF